MCLFDLPGGAVAWPTADVRLRRGGRGARRGRSPSAPSAPARRHHGKWRGRERTVPGGLVPRTERDGDLVVVGAVAVNAHGQIDDGRGRAAWPRASPGDRAVPGARPTRRSAWSSPTPGSTSSDCHWVAQGGHDGFARALVPGHGRSDGELVAAATGRGRRHRRPRAVPRRRASSAPSGPLAEPTVSESEAVLPVPVASEWFDEATGVIVADARAPVRVDADHGRVGPRAWPSLARAGDLVCSPATSAPARPPSPRASARGLGVDEPITSPTFTLVRSTTTAACAAPPRRLPARPPAEVDDLGLAELLDDERGHAHRVGRRHRRRAARPTTSRCASPRRRTTTTAIVELRVGRAAWAAAHRALHAVARPRLGRAGRADPRHRDRHRPGRVRHRRPRGRARPVRSRRGAAATPRRWRRPSSSSCRTGPDRARRDLRRRRRHRPGPVHRPAGRRRHGQGHGPRRCGCR